jgi:endonuclease G, mitochondrial
VSLGEAIGLVREDGTVIPATRLRALAIALGVKLPAAEPEEIDEGGLERKLEPADYADRPGYEPGFLGTAVPLPKPRPGGLLDEDLLEHEGPDGSASTVLPYTHFSVVMSKSRRMSMFTAVNIAGKSLELMERTATPWQLDPRIERGQQFGKELYLRNDLDRGHMVRRLDPVWGESAETANDDTFHYTNACPQHKDLNQKIWNDLEEYIYQNANKNELKVNVFTGPVFSGDDPEYRGARIPLQFWKVVTMVRDDGELSATAYILSQADMIQGLEFAFGEYRTYQIPIVKLEEMTGLDFGSLRDHDPKRPSGEGLESSAESFTLVEKPGDLRLFPTEV